MDLDLLHAKVAEQQLAHLRQLAASFEEKKAPPEEMAALPVDVPENTEKEPSRPIPTPSRSEAVLPRPVSTDAQPSEQRLWEDSFPATLPDQVDEAAAPEALMSQAVQECDSDDDILIGDIDPVARLQMYCCVTRVPNLYKMYL